MNSLNFDPINLTQELVKCPSITPKDAGTIKFLSKKLKKLGFNSKILEFKDKEILGDKLYDKINWLGGSPGNDYVAVEFQDKETVLEFQRKIKTFGNPVNIEFVNW